MQGPVHLPTDSSSLLRMSAATASTSSSLTLSRGRQSTISLQPCGQTQPSTKCRANSLHPSIVHNSVHNARPIQRHSSESDRANDWLALQQTNDREIFAVKFASTTKNKHTQFPNNEQRRCSHIAVLAAHLNLPCKPSPPLLILYTTPSRNAKMLSFNFVDHETSENPQKMLPDLRYSSSRLSIPQLDRNQHIHKAPRESGGVPVLLTGRAEEAGGGEDRGERERGEGGAGAGAGAIGR